MHLSNQMSAACEFEINIIKAQPRAVSNAIRSTRNGSVGLKLLAQSKQTGLLTQLDREGASC